MTRHAGLRCMLPLLLSAALLGSVHAPASAAESRCDPDVYFELDALGFVTAYPAARCTGSDTFKGINIVSIFSVDGNWIETQKGSYSDKPAGVYPIRGSSARNPEGTNSFCATVTVDWAYRLSQTTKISSGTT